MQAKPPSGPPSTRSRSRPSPRSVTGAIGDSASCSKTTKNEYEARTPGQLGSRYYQDLLLAQQPTAKGVATAKSFRSSKLEDEEVANAGDPTMASDTTSTSRDDGVIIISDSAQKFLINVQGFNHAKAAVDATAMAVLPNNYMAKVRMRSLS